MPDIGKTIKYLAKLKGPETYAAWRRDLENAFLSHDVGSIAEGIDIKPGATVNGSGPLPTAPGQTAAKQAVLAGTMTATNVAIPVDTATWSAWRCRELVAQALITGSVERGYDVVLRGKRAVEMLEYLAVQFKPDIERERREIMREILSLLLREPINAPAMEAHYDAFMKL
ncbi:hypothetical protein Q5752_000852 [Cryptotrichosporon argae]